MIPTTNAKQICFKNSPKQKKLHSISLVEESSGKFKSVDGIFLKLNILVKRTISFGWMYMY